MKKYLPYLNILGAAACWGCIGLFNRFLMRAGMGAANIVVIRNFGGLVLLTLIFALRERSVFHVKAKHLPIFFGTGVVSMVFFTLCYFKCQELCSLAVSAILLYTAPAMVVLMSAAVFRERITRKKILALALALSLAGCQKEETVTAPAGVAVQVQTVEAQDIASENTVSGQVTAGSETSVYVTATAKCTAVYVEAGDAVKAGDVICSLDMESSLAQYRAAEIGYTSAASSYSDQKNILDRQVALYEKNWNDTKALFEIGAASQSEVDQMELQYLSTKAQRDSTLAQLEASMQSAKSSYEQLALAMENIDSHGNVIAPVDGVLASLTASEGGMVSPSYAVAVIDGAEQMKVNVMVSEALVPKLAIGDTVTVRVSAADAEFEGVIRSVEKTANQVTKLYTVTVTVPAEVEGLLSGMFADVTFHTAVSESAVVVPSEAILTSSDRQYVFIVENDTAKRVDITTGLTGSGMTEVTSGLDAGEQLVTVGQQYLSDGDAVRVVEG